MEWAMLLFFCLYVIEIPNIWKWMGRIYFEFKLKSGGADWIIYI